MESKQNTDPYAIVWHGERVGTISNTSRDMWLFEGTWMPNDTETATAFEQLARSSDMRKVYSDWSKGTYVLMEVPGPALAQIHSIVLGIHENVLVLRNVFDPEAVQWAMQHCQ